MEAVGSRLSRASSRYGAPTVFSGPVRKWKKKWVHVNPSSLHTTNNSHSHTNNTNSNGNGSSRLLLRRWTPITAPSTVDDGTGNVADEPPRRKFRYTPIAVLEEQKKMVVEKVEYETTSENDQLTARETNVTHESHGKLNMNETAEETKDSNISKLDLDLGLEGNNGESSQNNDDQLEIKYPVADP